MTDGAEELRALAHDLREAPVKAQAAAVGVVRHGALNVKRGWQDNARTSAGRHGRRYPSSIGYDTDIDKGHIEAEIGPDKNRPQGALGNLIEFGSVHNPPHNDGGRALRVEAPKFEHALAEVALDALGWR